MTKSGLNEIAILASLEVHQKSANDFANTCEFFTSKNNDNSLHRENQAKLSSC